MTLDIETQDGYWVFVDTNTGKEITEAMSTKDAIRAMLTNSIKVFVR